MCLRLENDSVKKQIADKDIIVYKYLYCKINNNKESYITPFMGFSVKIGKLYKSRIRKYNSTIETGLHSFANQIDCEKEGNCDLPRFGYVVIVSCTIPKGAHYYLGSFDIYSSYASSRLIINEIVKTIHN